MEGKEGKENTYGQTDGTTYINNSGSKTLSLQIMLFTTNYQLSKVTLIFSLNSLPKKSYINSSETCKTNAL